MFCPTALSIASYAYLLMPFTEKNLSMCSCLVFICTISGPYIEDLVLRNRRVVFDIKKCAVNGPIGPGLVFLCREELNKYIQLYHVSIIHSEGILQQPETAVGIW